MAAQGDKDSKQAKLEKVAAACLGIVHAQGPRALTLSRVARSAGVSRAWIYKYIGGSHDELIECAAEYFGKIYSRLEKPFRGETPKVWIEDEIEAFGDTIDLVEQYEWIIPLYYRFKGTSSALGRAIDKIESAYFKKKVAQLVSAGVSKPDSVMPWAEFLAAFKLSIVHRYVVAGMKKRLPREELMKMARAVFASFARINAGS